MLTLRLSDTRSFAQTMTRRKDVRPNWLRPDCSEILVSPVVNFNASETVGLVKRSASVQMRSQQLRDPLRSRPPRAERFN
jgi:hypothetical protein